MKIKKLVSIFLTLVIIGSVVLSGAFQANAAVTLSGVSITVDNGGGFDYPIVTVKINPASLTKSGSLITKLYLKNSSGKIVPCSFDKSVYDDCIEYAIILDDNGTFSVYVTAEYGGVTKTSNVVKFESANKYELVDLYYESQYINTKRMTDESAAALATAITKAEIVLNNDDAKQTEIEKASAELRAAIDNLEKKYDGFIGWFLDSFDRFVEVFLSMFLIF